VLVTGAKPRELATRQLDRRTVVKRTLELREAGRFGSIYGVVRRETAAHLLRETPALRR
jgi:hypothetical protein